MQAHLTKVTMKLHTHPGLPGLALVCALGLGLVACDRRENAATTAVPGTTVGTEIDDSVITTRVKSALLADHDIKSFDIKVETRKGQVQLSGFIDTRERMDKAMALVRKVEGVKGVDNGMTLKEGQTTMGNAVDDSVITTRVKSALFAVPDIKSFDIAVVTRKGEVQLSGFIDSEDQINRILAIVRSVEGVQGVVNEMKLKK
jgi:hyperosmotically inducible protein